LSNGGRIRHALVLRAECSANLPQGTCYGHVRPVGKVALITGSSRGIGKAIAMQMALHGGAS